MHGWRMQKQKFHRNPVTLTTFRSMNEREMDRDPARVNLKDTRYCLRRQSEPVCTY